MCRRFPETPVIIDHVCGISIKDGLFPETEVRALSTLARHKRVLVKLGPFQALGAGQAPYLDLLPLIRRVVDAFGPERCMWESDSGGPIPMANPQSDYPAAVALIRDHADFLSPTDKRPSCPRPPSASSSAASRAPRSDRRIHRRRGAARCARPPAAAGGP